ncbi:MAG: hypothetical protein NVSMB56_01640 [Pyrinomonadaceae bacterium]
MLIETKKVVAVMLLAAAFVSGCKSSQEVNSNATSQSVNAKSDTAKKNDSSGKPGADGIIASGTGVEKEKPAAGKANVQGKVFYNEQPAAGIEVKLCETFSQYLGGCGGEMFTTKTDSGGEYLFKNVPPKLYEGLTVKIFNTNYYVFATSGIIQSAKYKIEEGRTFFAPNTNLYKLDLKLLNPKAGSKINSRNIGLNWDSYPDAAYYKFSIYADTASGATTNFDYINKRIAGLSYVLDKPLSPGTYTCKVEAYNGNDIKLAQSPDDIKFTVTE